MGTIEHLPTCMGPLSTYPHAWDAYMHRAPPTNPHAWGTTHLTQMHGAPNYTHLPT